jgi:hypothetical protein
MDLISPAFNIYNIIQNILRGGDDDNIPPTRTNENTPPIGLVPDPYKSRSVSPDMLVYASDQVDQTPKPGITQLPPVAPTPPPAPPLPSNNPEIEATKPSSLLDQIKKGKSLKSVRKMVEKDKTPDKPSSILDALKNKMDTIRPMVENEDTDDKDY